MVGNIHIPVFIRTYIHAAFISGDFEAVKDSRIGLEDAVFIDFVATFNGIPADDCRRILTFDQLKVSLSHSLFSRVYQSLHFQKCHSLYQAMLWCLYTCCVTFGGVSNRPAKKSSLSNLLLCR